MIRYLLDDTDRQLVQRAVTLLRQVVAAGLATPAQLVSVGKALHALGRMPNVASVGDISLRLIGPRQNYDDIEVHFWWDVAFEGDLITIGSGGHFYRSSTGGDTFQTMTWQAYPGEPAELSDFSQHLAIVPGLRSFLTDVPTTEELAEGFELSVDDESNELLEEESDQDEDEEESDEQADDDEESGEIDEEEAEDADWVISPQDEVEQTLARQVNPAAVDAREPQFAYGVGDCGICGRELSNCGVMVDGRLKGSLMWGNLCAHCFAVQGEGLGNGVGQLYARQPDGHWRLVAGFPR